MKTKHKYAVGQKVLFNDQIHTVAQKIDDPAFISLTYDIVRDMDGNKFKNAFEHELLPLIKESDGKVYVATKPKATRPRKKVFSTDKSGK